MRKPNLFVVGAPKCETTALHAYLTQHPECFMSSVKEPAYLKLFADARDVHKIIGESSTSYMRAEDDLEELRTFSENPKIIASVRDPVSLVSSYFHYLRFQGWEPLNTLREAWDIQDERCAGHVASVAANRPDSLASRNVALLGQQVECLFRMSSREKVLVLVVDDLCDNTANVCRNLQNFLGLTYVENIEMPHRNVARAARVQIIDGLVKCNSKTVLQVKNRINRLFGVRSLGIRRLIERFNSAQTQHSVDAELRDEMRQYFQHDLTLLGRLLERNLFELWGWEKAVSARSGRCKAPAEIWR